MPNKTVYLYTGENSQVVQTENGDRMTMQDFKNKHFSEVVKHWNEADCVIYTQTLSVGVDYSVEESKSFDTFVSLYIGGDIQADSFVQSLMRCRNYRDKTHTIFMKSFDNIKLKRNFSPLDEYIKHGIDLQHDKLDRALDMFRRSTGNRMCLAA